MNITNQSSPNFRMNVKGLNHSYFNEVPNKLKNAINKRAGLVTSSDFSVEFLPMKNNWVFLRKISGDKSTIVDYFPAGYNSYDIAQTFYSRCILPRFVMAKNIINETNAKEAQAMYQKYACLN